MAGILKSGHVFLGYLDSFNSLSESHIRENISLKKIRIIV